MIPGAKGVVPGAPGAPKNAISKATDGNVGIPKAANIPGAKGPLPINAAGLEPHEGHQPWVRTRLAVRLRLGVLTC